MHTDFSCVARGLKNPQIIEPTKRQLKGVIPITASKRKLLTWLGCGLLVSASIASAQVQTYPQRPIKAIVPYAAGGF